jgi:hypothetical protein
VLPKVQPDRGGDDNHETNTKDEDGDKTLVAGNAELKDRKDWQCSDDKLETRVDGCHGGHQSELVDTSLARHAGHRPESSYGSEQKNQPFVTRCLTQRFEQEVYVHALEKTGENGCNEKHGGSSKEDMQDPSIPISLAMAEEAIVQAQYRETHE